MAVSMSLESGVRWNIDGGDAKSATDREYLSMAFLSTHAYLSHCIYRRLERDVI